MTKKSAQGTTAEMAATSKRCHCVPVAAPATKIAATTVKVA